MKVKLLKGDTDLNIYINAIKQSCDKELKDYKGREDKIISNCLRNCHNTVLEQGNFQFEIETTIGISRDTNRHRPHSIVERSTRYVDFRLFSNEELFEIPPEIIINSDLYKEWVELLNQIKKVYNNTINVGFKKQIAKQCLPLCTVTKLTVNATLWHWIVFIKSRLIKSGHPHYVEMARKIYKILNNLLPTIVNKDNLEYIKPVNLII